MSLTEQEERARMKICHPLDNLESMKDVRERVKILTEHVGLFKIGKENFTRFGPDAVYAVKRLGADVVLDLKYHDIPNTVKEAAKAAAGLGVYMFNVHTAGGLDMMKAAMEGAQEGATGKRPLVTGVTVLTSLSEKDLGSVCVSGTIPEVILARAKLAEEAGLDGIVCGAADLAGGLKQKLRDGFIYLTPGIKGLTTEAGKDQKRVADPVSAVQNGASILVIGRAISGAQNMEQEAYKILQAIAPYA